ncbi:MAG: sugar ABC transporter ATP-binding protein [Alphaproteobacteria bacterium]
MAAEPMAAAGAGGPVLELSGISKSFPGVRALDDVSLDLRPGEVHALMGENGAGKSTLIKIMAGVYARDAGTIRIAGAPVEFSTPGEAIAAGIKVVFQEIALIPEFTVAENIFLEDHPVGRFGGIDWKEIRARARALFERVGFALDPDARVGRLPVSQQQLVEICRALVHEARVVVMDEPTSALTPQEIERLFAVIRRLKGMGIAILYVSHKLDEIFAISDVTTVLRDGRWVSTRPTAEHNQESLIQDMVGRQIGSLFPRTERTIGEVRLKVEGLSTAAKLRDVSFEARAGEVVGLFGLMGAGRTELAKAIVGYDPIAHGTISVDGAPLRPHSTRRGVSIGIGLLSEDRKSEGLMLELPVLANMSLAALDRLSPHGFVDRARERAEAQTYVDRFRIKVSDLRQPVETLSGGNQQKVLLSRWLMHGLKVIVVDEPTRGIDVGAKAEIFALVDELAQKGLAIVMMSSEMPELLGLADRILVLARGRITAEFDRGHATQEAILDAAIL